MSRKQMQALFAQICADFESIPVTQEEKVKVGRGG